MSLQLRYCERCGKAWPVRPDLPCPSCKQQRVARDAITVIHNLHRALATALANEPTKPHDERK